MFYSIFALLQRPMLYNDQNKKSRLSHSRSSKIQQTSKTFNSSLRSSITNKNLFNLIKNTLGSTAKNNQNVQCTFEPHTHQKKGKRRSMEKFMKDQESFLDNKQRRIQQLRNEINRAQDQELTGMPLIDHSYKTLNFSQTNSNVKNTNIFQRLSKEKMMKRNSSFSEQESLFSPKILNRSKSMVRRQNVSNLLYEDAKRRQEKDQMMADSERKQRDMMMLPKINSNTNALVLKRIMSQFQDLVTDEEINPLIGLSVLQEIFNVDLNPNKNEANNELVKRLIMYLNHSNGSCMITAQKLKQFIAIIINGTTQNSLFSTEEERQIYENFQFFYKQRVTKERKTLTPEKLTFRPKTLRSSTKMAGSFRQKAFQQVQNFIENERTNLSKDGNYTLSDIYHIDHLKKQSDKQKKKIQLENKQIEKCTFKPDLADSKRSMNLIKKKPKVTLKPSKKQIQRTQYTCNQSEAQLQALNVTKIIPFRSRQQKQRRRRQRQSLVTNLSDNVKDVDKVILRMSIGRQKREMSQSYLERGYPKCQNWAQHQKNMQKKTEENNKKLIGLGIR